MEGYSEKGKVSTSVVMDVNCNEDDKITRLDSILVQLYIWVKITLCMAVTVVTLVGCAFTIYIFITAMLHAGDSQPVPYDHNTQPGETTTTYLTDSTEGALEVTKSPANDHPRLISADSESLKSVLETIRRQNQSLLALECRPTPRKEKAVSLLSPKDRILDKDFFPKDISIEKCDDVYSYCGVGKSVCVPARNNTGKKAVTFWYYEGEETVIETRAFESDSDCECQ
ncbi:uncharacterized protein LOC125044842 [Penaeus chinensis]|uniref:uncharacterized protein LOC125044842 n=1 Tax=Penaeus chinensis TaxID=139456 RepID=UPI001FB7AFDD|nr:uncharacterized protein LOC125044842 [Penaeus chinensis]XP_047497759.1 uncharacterized protein LOC125044842 [Penaeus chinensis]